MKDYYQILGLEKNASKEEIKKAFRLYATKYHPDKQSGDKFFEERFKEIYSAYETLSDDKRRREYDLLFSNNSNITKNKEFIYNDLLRKEEELLRKEREIKIKETELNFEKYHLEKSERLKKEYELSRIIYYRDYQVIISGVNLQINNVKYSFDDYINVKSRKINRSKNQASNNSKAIYGLATLSIIIGVFAIGLAIGLILIILGFIILISGLFSNILGYFYNIIKDIIWPKYQLVIIGKSSNKPMMQSNRYRILKIEKILKNALDKYYAV